MPQENGAGMADLAHVFEGIVNLKLEVFRRDPVGQGNRRGQVFDHQYGTKALQGFPRNSAARQCGQLFVNCGGNLPGDFFRIRYQDSG